jgi:hypothetical protein
MGKITSSRFIVAMAARPGQQLDYMGSNFYFLVTDQIHQAQRALYYFGNIDAPPPQQPITWSMTIPPIITTPQPLGVADWAGQAIFSETNRNYVLNTKIWVAPDVLKGHTIPFEIHAHLDEPQSGISRHHFSAAFQLREVSPDVQYPGISEVTNWFKILPPFRVCRAARAPCVSRQIRSPQTSKAIIPGINYLVAAPI